MQCTKCGAELFENSKFCGNCGEVLVTPKQEMPDPVVLEQVVPEQVMPEQKVKKRKERRFLRLVHLIPLSLCLIGICVSFFLPFMKFDTDTVNHVADMVISDLDEDIQKTSGDEKDEVSKLFREESEQWKKDNLQNMQEMIIETLDAARTNYSLWDLITMPDGVARRALTYLQQKDVDTSEYHGAWEAEIGQTVSLVQKILLVIGIVTILLLIVMIIVKIFKRTKFVFLIITTIYSALLATVSACMIWGGPGIIWEIVPQSDFGIGVEYSTLIYKIMGKAVFYSWSQVITNGMYVLFISSVALFVFSIFSLVTFNKKGKEKKKKIQKPAVAMLLVCGITISSMTGCTSVKDTELSDSERAQFVDMFRYSINVNREQEDYKTLQMVMESLVYAVKKKGIDKSAYRVNSEGLSDNLKQLLEEKMGKTIEEVEQSFKSDVCKGNRIIFMCSHAVIDGGEAGAYLAVYLDECKGVYDPSIEYFIDERCRI